MGRENTGGESVNEDDQHSANTADGAPAVTARNKKLLIRKVVTGVVIAGAGLWGFLQERHAISTSNHPVKVTVGSAACYGVVYLAVATHGRFSLTMPEGISQVSDFDGVKAITICATKGERVDFTVHNNDVAGTVSCKVEVQGVTVASRSLTGAFLTADCTTQI